MLLRFYKNWALPISMVLGALSYLLYTVLPLPEGTGAFMSRIISILQPALIFGMLFITFCKLRPTELKPCRWHAWLLLIQVGMFALMAGILIAFPNLPDGCS